MYARLDAIRAVCPHPNRRSAICYDRFKTWCVDCGEMIEYRQGGILSTDLEAADEVLNDLDKFANLWPGSSND